MTTFLYIDEAFLDLTGTERSEPLAAHCRRIQEQVYRNVGLPVCVGASTTKTLAKLANRAAKKYPKTSGVVDLTDPARQRRLLAITDVADVWGVGPRLSKRLRSLNIHTALDLAQSDPKDIRRRFSVVLERTARELNGEACIELETAPEAQQQIVCSRSFGDRVVSRDSMHEALASFTAQATARLRKQNRVARSMAIYIRTSPFTPDPQYSNALTTQLPYPGDDTRSFLEQGRLMLDRIWRDGYRYAKAGVMLSDFYDPRQLQADLFDNRASADKRSAVAVMEVMDRINNEMKGALRFASEGLPRSKGRMDWEMNQAYLSPRYTTRFTELPIVHIK